MEFHGSTKVAKSLGISVQHCAILREVAEELGLAPMDGKMVEVEEQFRDMVVFDKANWFPLALDGDISIDTEGIRIISMRTTSIWSNEIREHLLSYPCAKP